MEAGIGFLRSGKDLEHAGKGRSRKKKIGPQGENLLPAVPSLFQIAKQAN